MRRRHVIRAIFLREVFNYFSTPTGYVFISLFVFLSALAAFWQERFFATNLANLDQLNRFFPYLLVFFIPAVSMSLWAEERKQGTEELLLTLPASDAEVVLGKYLAGLAIYTVALVFSVSHVVVLSWLGSPDPGLMLATYVGYWLMGAALLALAMLASLVTDNLTVAFILGSLLCSAAVFLERAGAILRGGAQRLAERLSVVEQFRDLSTGVITLHAAGLLHRLRRRGALRQRGAGGPPALALARLRPPLPASGRSRWWPSWPASPCSPRRPARAGTPPPKRSTRSPNPPAALLAGLDPRQPVFIEAYFSPDVPRSYMDARHNLSAMLREFDAVGREAVHVRIHETVKYSPEAREALDRFNIRPYRVPVTEESGGGINEIFLGLAFTCGSEEFTIPFFDRGLPVEYELMRSIRVVSHAKRRKVGILNTPAKLFGGFDFQSRAQSSDWSIVAELRKQYEVVQVAPDADYPADLDVLLAALPSALPQAAGGPPHRLREAAASPCWCCSTPCRRSTWTWRRRRSPRQPRPSARRRPPRRAPTSSRCSTRSASPGSPTASPGTTTTRTRS